MGDGRGVYSTARPHANPGHATNGLTTHTAIEEFLEHGNDNQVPLNYQMPRNTTAPGTMGREHTPPSVLYGSSSDRTTGIWFEQRIPAQVLQNKRIMQLKPTIHTGDSIASRAA